MNTLNSVSKKSGAKHYSLRPNQGSVFFELKLRNDFGF
jgi:hypothetical protein